MLLLLLLLFFARLVKLTVKLNYLGSGTLMLLLPDQKESKGNL